MSAGLALLARDRGGPAICFQYLGIPELDDRLETPSMQAFVDTPMWSRPAAEKSWEWYLGDLWRTDDVPAYASPARAENLSGLPPAYVSVMEFDPLRDEGLDYAVRMIRAGGIQGAPRLTRHLWRMCVALFAASSSFYVQVFLRNPPSIPPCPVEDIAFEIAGNLDIHRRTERGVHVAPGIDALVQGTGHDVVGVGGD